ncbi:PAS domain-containing protein [Umezawaea beigongshangensis]|uniref:PAS domain-containing protein n=1 Tax=Umezawaea beigongshangensis TaxID=2780383 RepID=UPI0018F2130F|nr:PAS domain-containing protein [Umezawaea beigongshangensis]
MSERPVAERLAPVCEAVARLLSPHADVVLHDPRTDRVVAIWNALSGRVPGDPPAAGRARRAPRGGRAGRLRAVPKSLHLGHTETCGLPALREAVASTCDEVAPEDVLCFAGAAEARCAWTSCRNGACCCCPRAPSARS